MPTPAVAGTIRYAALNPYWFVPPDLIRERARKVLRRGPGVIAAEHLQVLSDWSPNARVLKASQVDWRAVASGKHYVNLRQLPGAWNMMGRIKFMFANPYGVYLHDTPLRELFARPDRHESSGCIRLEDAARMERWLFQGRLPRPSGATEERADLPDPVPVYITYLTALPTRDGVRFQSDVYGRDRIRTASARHP
jgi:murein L,D-transpeptidase YcbB/YkuD